MKLKNFYYPLILVSIIFFIWSFAPQKNENLDFSKQVKITLRQVGNQLLLTNKDSLSLILPIKEIENSKYRISFENKLLFEPTNLVRIMRIIIKKVS